MKLILASTSPYRRELIEKTGVALTQVKPALDEEAAKKLLISLGRTPLQMAEELAYQKGDSVLQNQALQENECLLSGDQLVNFEGEIRGQPGNFENAFQQLKSMNNKWHELITSVVLFTPRQILRHTEVTRLKMRDLSETEIKNYILLDQPFNCSGSYKFEKNGIILFEKIEAHDPSAIQGVPLVWLCTQLKENGYELFKQ